MIAGRQFPEMSQFLSHLPVFLEIFQFGETSPFRDFAPFPGNHPGRSSASNSKNQSPIGFPCRNQLVIGRSAPQRILQESFKNPQRILRESSRIPDYPSKYRRAGANARQSSVDDTWNWRESQSISQFSFVKSGSKRRRILEGFSL